MSIKIEPTASPLKHVVKISRIRVFGSIEDSATEDLTPQIWPGTLETGFPKLSTTRTTAETRTLNHPKPPNPSTLRPSRYACTTWAE